LRRYARAALRHTDALDELGPDGAAAWRERVEDGEHVIEEAGGKLVGVW